MKKLPLIHHYDPDAPLYYLADGSVVSQSRFIAQVCSLAGHWLVDSEVINLCENHHEFMLAFAAAGLCGAVTILPSSHGADHLNDLRQRYPEAKVVKQISPPGVEPWPGEVPQLDYEQARFIMFTSGSTGAPEPRVKTWRDFHTTVMGSSGALGLRDRPCSMVATVPLQHAYGMETAGLMPLFIGMSARENRPFFPADIIEALRAVPEPRILVTTPVHLRVLAGSGLTSPILDGIVCSTAPLQPAVARQAEEKLDAPVLEIYGCSEVGSFAARRPTQGSVWTLYDGYALNQEGETTGVRSPIMDHYFQLSDRIELVGTHGFALHGRSGDIIKVAGKRSSLTELTLTLQGLPGVEDAVVFLASDQVSRPAALVVAPGWTEAQLRHELSRHIDDVFIPRPLRCVDSLPRNELGKLPRAGLLAALEKARKQGRKKPDEH